MKVALLSYDFGEYCIRLAGALAADVEVLLLLPHERAAPHLAQLNPAVRFQPFDKPRLRQPRRQLRTVRALLDHIRRFEPDVIHLQQGHLWFNFGLPLLRRYPLVLTVHDPRRHTGDRGGQKTPQVVMDFGFRQAQQIITHGAQLRDVLVDECGIVADSIHIIPHIVLGDESIGPSVPEDDHLVLFFGRIWPYKGLEYLIRAEPLITARCPDARIMIAGQGEDFERYRRMMVHPEKFVVYNDFISYEQRAEMFRRASVVVLPYVEATQSGVIPIAYTFARPVVATSVGALPEMVEHEQTGILVPPRDERELADAVVRLLGDPDLRRRLGTNGKRKIDTECSPEAVAHRTLAVYHRALAGRQPARTS